MTPLDTAQFAVMETGSSSSQFSLIDKRLAPKLMLIIFDILLFTIYSIADITSLPKAAPLLLKAFAIHTFAFGATPIAFVFMPFAVIIPAILVPCPLSSSNVPMPSIKLFPPIILSISSGWSVSMPVSITATVIPEPLKPKAHTSSALIWLTDSISDRYRILSGNALGGCTPFGHLIAHASLSSCIVLHPNE